MNRKTAAKYVKLGKCPSDLKKERTWRTRPDPFKQVWPEIESRLNNAPELEARILFEDLMERNRGAFEPGQLRTFQRRVKSWRAQKGPAKEVFFPQMHRAGEAAQTDFTWANELNVTIAGKVFEHMLCHFVLPYSNWQWATICHSESMSSLKHGIQDAVFQPEANLSACCDSSHIGCRRLLPGGRVRNTVMAWTWNSRPGELYFYERAVTAPDCPNLSATCFLFQVARFCQKVIPLLLASSHGAHLHGEYGVTGCLKRNSIHLPPKEPRPVSNG
ncbi:MAG: hypothetical protein GY930_02980 [bacterium]|nr:hypothetical protein [bacterium]